MQKVQKIILSLYIIPIDFLLKINYNIGERKRDKAITQKNKNK